MRKLFAPVLVLTVLLQEWLFAALLGPRHLSATLVILFSLLLCLEYNRRYSTAPAQWGFSVRDFLPALGWILAFVSPVALSTIVVSSSLDLFSGREHPVQDLAALFVWALAQQFALQTVLYRETRRQWKGRRARLAAALLFALLHLPNPFLVPVTFFGAWFFCWVYSRHPNLLPLALGHAGTSLTILAGFPPELTGSMRVGYSYLEL